MKNSFAEEYKREQEIRKSYEIAEKANDEQGIEIARRNHHILEEEIEAKGEMYVRIYNWYSEARDCGNEYIDLHDAIWDYQVEGLIKEFRNHGIEKFTFSSTWSSAVEIAWLFKENGCSLEGLIEINKPFKAFMSDEYEKTHGYLFSVN